MVVPHEVKARSQILEVYAVNGPLMSAALHRSGHWISQSFFGDALAIPVNSTNEVHLNCWVMYVNGSGIYLLCGDPYNHATHKPKWRYGEGEPIHQHAHHH